MELLGYIPPDFLYAFRDTVPVACAQATPREIMNSSGGHSEDRSWAWRPLRQSGHRATAAAPVIYQKKPLALGATLPS